MHEVKNVALVEFQEKAGKKINEMNDDELQDVCIDFGIVPEYLHENEYDPNIITGFDSIETVKKILNSFTYSYYMSTDFFRTAHKDKASKFKLSKKLSKAGTGTETYKLFKDLAFGFYQLQSGDKVELDVSKEWINNYLLYQPCVRLGHLVVTDLETKEELKPAISEEALRAKIDIEGDVQNINMAKLAELRQTAKILDIKDYMRKSEKELRAIIKSKL